MEVLRTSPGRHFVEVLKKVVETSISDQSKTSLRLKVKVFTTSLRRHCVAWGLLQFLKLYYMSAAAYPVEMRTSWKYNINLWHEKVGPMLSFNKKKVSSIRNNNSLNVRKIGTFKSNELLLITFIILFPSCLSLFQLFSAWVSFEEYRKTSKDVVFWGRDIIKICFSKHYAEFQRKCPWR